MTITIENTSIPEVKIIIGKRIYDDRGFFAETYKELEYLEIGIPRFVQDNISESSKGVIRGLHWQDSPCSQGKLVTCMTGKIIDVAVDIRPTSPSFGQHVAVELNSEHAHSLWIPAGFAHGFQSLEDGTRVSYKVTDYWNKESERSINFLDPKLKISFANIKPLLSIKDQAAPYLDQIVEFFEKRT